MFEKIIAIEHVKDEHGVHKHGQDEQKMDEEALILAERIALVMQPCVWLNWFSWLRTVTFMIITPGLLPERREEVQPTYHPVKMR